MLLHRIFERCASQNSNRDAISYQGSVMKYEQLNVEANRLAAEIRHVRGPKTSSVVAICLEKGPSMVISVLAVLKAEMAWVPIPTGAPKAYVEKIFAVARPAVLLTSQATLQVASGLCDEIIVDDDATEKRIRQNTGTDWPVDRDGVGADDLCHIIFTSGSTGTPKGVMVEHRALAHNARVLAETFELDQDTRTLQFAAYTFDVFGLDLFMTFLVGGCLVMDSVHNMVADMTGFINGCDVSYAQLTPTVASLITPGCVPPLRTLACSGEPLTEEIFRQWRGRVRLFNAYGPTETIVCTLQRMNGQEHMKPEYIGTAIDSLDVVLMERDVAKEVAPGSVGELCVAGVQLFRGYLGTHANESAPFFYHGSRRFYRTGDLGVLVPLEDSTHTIRLLGRTDGQVKVHGVRVDLGDVESAIGGCVSTQHCVTMIPKAGCIEGRLLAIVSLHDSGPWELLSTCIPEMDLMLPTEPNQRDTLTRIINEIRSILPPQAVPSSWWIVSRFPLTASGKIDRLAVRRCLEAMPEPVYSRFVQCWTATAGHSADSGTDSPLQRQLIDLCGLCLGLDTTAIDPRASLLQLGFDSLAMIKLVSMARSAGIGLAMQQVLGGRSIAQLVETLSAMSVTHPLEASSTHDKPLRLVSSDDKELASLRASAAEQCSVDIDEIIDIWPCTPLQAGMMALAARSDNAYICDMKFVLQPGVDRKRLENAWLKLVSEVPLLRTRIVHDPTGSGLLQATIRNHLSFNGQADTPMSFGNILSKTRISQDEATGEWVFSLTIHHALFDGWTKNIILRELKHIYDSGETPAAATSGFRKFVRYVVDDIRENEASHLSFWGNHLDGCVVPDFPRTPPGWTGEQRQYETLVDRIDIDISLAARKHQVTVATVIRASWAIVLGAHAGVEDVVFGVTLSGRDTPVDELDRVVGPTMATVPCRARWDKSVTLHQLLQSLHQQSIDVISRQHFGLQNIARAGEGAKNACAFRCLVVVQPDDSVDETSLSSLMREKADEDGRFSSEMLQTYPLTLELLPSRTGVGVGVRLHFDKSVISRQELVWVVRHLGHALGRISSANPLAPAADVGIADKAEAEWIMDCSRSCPPKIDRCLHELVENACRSFADHVAVVQQSPPKSVSFRELEASSTNLSWRLRKHGVRRGDVIPISFEKSTLAIIAMLAVLKSGAAYTPLDSTQPNQHLSQTINSPKPRFALCSAQTSQAIRQLNAVDHVLEIDQDWLSDVPNADSDVAPAAHRVSPDDVAFIFFSSKGAGLPKGVATTHSAASTSITHFAELLGMRPGSRVLQSISLSSDLSLKDVFCTLLSGGCVCLPTEDARSDSLPDAMWKLGVNVASWTPAVAEALNPDQVPSLDIVILGGGRAAVSVVQKWAARTRLINSYGHTETGACLTAVDMSPEDRDPHNIGNPVSGQVWVVQRNTEGSHVLAPVGCVGEIAVSGFTIALGYLNDAEKTAKPFVLQPHWMESHTDGRLYLTGDPGIRKPDGCIIYAGGPGHEVGISGTQKPAAISGAGQQYMPPETKDQILVCNAWNEVLGATKRFGLKDDFFRVGGDSFTAIRLVLACKKVGIKLLVAQIYTSPTLEGMSASVEHHEPTKILAPIPFSMLTGDVEDLVLEISETRSLDAQKIEDMYPASPFQEGLAAANLQAEGAYMARWVYALPKTVHLKRLVVALGEVIMRNPIFRTTLAHSSRGPMQVVQRYRPHSSKCSVQANGIPTNRDSQKRLPGSLDTDEGAVEVVSEAFKHSVYRGDDGRAYLEINIHHMLYDEWVMEFLLSDLAFNYSHPGRERPGRLGYASFIRHLTTLDSQTSSDFWKRNLDGAGILDFPRNPPSGRQAQTNAAVDGTVPLSLQNSRASMTTPAAITAAGLGLILSSYCYTEDVIFGITLSGRDGAGLEEVAGPTLSTLPLRVKVSRGQEIGKFVSDVQSTIREIRQFQYFGLPNIARLGNGGARNACAFRTLLVVQQKPTALDSEGISFDTVQEDTSMTLNYALVVLLTTDRQAGQASLRIEYDSDCMPEQQARRFLRQLHHSIAQLSSMRGTIDSLDMVPKEDIEELRGMDNSRLGCLYIDRCLHHSVEERAAQMPAKAAIEWTGGSLTYGQLNQFADKGANLLIRRRTQSKFIVLCFGKCPMGVIAMLAILKAGCAYVPIEPSTPAPRLHGILQDLGSDVTILTEPQHAHLFHGLNTLSFDWEILRSDVSPPANAAVSSRDNAYVLYTSGSTGKPKGVLVSHGAIMSALAPQVEVAALDGESRALQFASFMFDISILDIFGSFLSGACLCMLSDDEKRVGAIASFVNTHRVNFLNVTPSVAQMLRPAEIPTVKTAILTAEPTPYHVFKEWADAGVRLVNGYGPTEACIHAAMDPNMSPSTHGTIGRAIGDSNWVVDPRDHTKLVPIGCVGELVVCGPNVATGYLNDSEKTAGAFGVDPPWLRFRKEKGVRYYRTGDLVQYRHDCSIFYLGRKDTQIKIRGQRVEAGEIESIIRTTNSLEAVVELLSDNTLVAFVKIPGSSAAGQLLLPPESIPGHVVEDITRKLRHRLPGYMVPSAIVPVAAFPITPSSAKINRKMLRGAVSSRVDIYRRARSSARRVPQTSSQVMLRDLWCSMVSVAPEDIGLDDDLHALGGDSITLIRLLSAAGRAGVSLSSRDINQFTTLEAMAQAVDAKYGTLNSEGEVEERAPAPFSLIGGSSQQECIDDAASKCGIEPEDIVDVYPCTPLQEGLMALSAKNSGSYLVQRPFRINGKFDEDKLKIAVHQVWQREAILRTRIFIGAKLDSLQAVIDEKVLPVTHYQGALDDYLESDRRVPFGYGRPLTRFAIVGDQVQGHYYLVISQHHAVSDGWATGLLVDAIKHAYAQNGEGDSRTPNWTPSFVRFVESVQALQDAADFWRLALRHALPTEFPFKRTSQATTWSAVSCQMPHLSQWPLSVLLEAAWGLVLSKHADSNDVCFGVVRSGRTVPLPGIESMMSPTIVTVPRRLKPQTSLTVAEYLDQVGRLVTEAAPFEQLGLQKIRTLSEDAKTACDFRTLFIVQPEENPNQAPSQLALEALDGGTMQGTYGLSVDCQPQAGGTLLISVNYDEAAVPEPEVQWVMSHFVQAISQLAARPTRLLRDVDMCSSQEREQIVTWNSACVEATNERVEDVFEGRLARWADLTAVDADDRCLTYHELNQAADRIAAILSACNVGPGKLAAVCMEKSALMIATLLGIFKAGAGYIPLAIDHPVDRLKGMLAHGDACVLVTSPSQKTLCDSLAAADKVVVLRWDDIIPRDDPDAASAELEVEGRQPSDLAYVMYTSGSTGAPKGVMLSHVAVTTTLLAQGERLGYKPGTRTLQFCSYTFDCSVTEIFMTLLHGGCLCIPTEEQRLTSLVEFINEQKVDMAVLTATVVSSMLQQPSNVTGLSTLMLVGEAMTQAVVDGWSDKVRLINDYGPTEACIDATVNMDVRPETLPGDIGRPIAARIWIVDREDRSKFVPIGCPGELLISGPTLAEGYLKDKAKTEAVFLDSLQVDWLPRGDCRLYATGDIARQTSDGSIIYISRNDSQVKLHGLRIELGEIEFHLTKHQRITAAVVDVARDKDNDEQVLVAFVVTTGENVSGAIQGALEGLHANLPRYMVPQFVLPMGLIPLTTSGKTDRMALKRAYDSATRQQLVSYVGASTSRRPPQSNSQKSLQHLWAQTLHLDLEMIGLDDGFFMLGGDSISAIKLSSLAREKGIHLSARDIFQNSIFEKMSLQMSGRVIQFDKESLAATMSSAPDYRSWLSEAYGVAADTIDDIYECTPLQAGLIALTLRVPYAYVSTEEFQLSPSMDIDQFKRAWDLVYQRHEILRARFFEVYDEEGYPKLVQALLSGGLTWLESTDLTEEPAMGLGTPMSRFTLHRTPEGYTFQLTRHHAIYDAWSSQLMWNDLKYAFEQRASPAPRPPFSTYVHHIQIQQSEAATQFWGGELSEYCGEHYPNLSSGYATIETNSVVGIFSKLDVGASGVSRTFTFANHVRAAWALVLAALGRAPSETYDVCFGAAVSGRMEDVPGIEDIAGPTINTVPVRVQIDVYATAGQYLRRVSDQTIAMVPYSHVGLSDIGKISKGAKSACLFRNILVVQQSDSQSGLLLEDVAPKPSSREMVQLYGLVMECTQAADNSGFHLEAGFDNRVLTESEVRTVLRHLSRTIELLHDSSRSTMSIQSLLADTATVVDYERMVSFNGPALPKSITLLHEFVEAGARLHPHRIAVLAHDQTLTYQELDTLSDRLATRLLDTFSVGLETLVPICFEKSSFMIIAMLGVLKAGGGYVPLDPSHPISRLGQIIKQTAAGLVLVSAAQNRRIRECGVDTLVVSNDTLASGSTDTSQLEHGTRPGTHNTAYLIFTSGSTGVPKGVAMEHGSITLSMLEHGRVLGFQREREFRTLQFCSYTFDVSVAEIFATFAFGGAVCIPTEEDRLSNLPSVISDMGVDVTFITPTMAGTLQPDEVPGLKTLIFTGESSPASLLATWTSTKRRPGRRVLNMYGPTEGAVHCTMKIMDAHTAPSVIGAPFGGQLWIVDAQDHTRLLPVGYAGELVISGNTLARSYLNNPGETSKAFIDSVTWFGDGNPRRIYKTGDIARFGDDGTLELLGRKGKGQVKINGVRIELGEVEAAMHAVGGFRNLAVEKAAVEGRESLVAFFQTVEMVGVGYSEGRDILAPEATWKASAEEMEKRLREELPRTMIPSLFLPVAVWPWTVSGKTDRKKLREVVSEMREAEVDAYRGRGVGVVGTTEGRSAAILPGGTGQARNETPLSSSTSDETNTTTPPSSTGGHSDAAATTDPADLVTRLWRRVLRRDDRFQPDLHDDFFRAGGDSISAIFLVSEFRRMGITVTAGELYEQRTLAHMVELVRASRHGHDGGLADRTTAFALLPAQNVGALRDSVAAELGARPGEIEDIYPCTPLQEGTVMLSERVAGSYHAHFRLLMPRELDMDRVSNAWRRLVEMHEVLRTRIVFDETLGSLQVVLGAASHQQQMGSGKKGAGVFGYGLPLYRTRLTAERDRIYLDLRCHHALYDGWSLSLLSRDLRCLYHNHDDAPPQISPFRDFIAYISNPSVASAEEEFWDSYLDGAVVSDFPELGGHANHDIRATAYSEHHISLGKQACQSENVATVLISAWSLIVSKYCGSDDVCFGLLLSGRNAPIPGIETVRGPTISTVPFRVVLDATIATADLVARVEAHMVAMISHQFRSLAKLRKLFPEGHRDFGSLLSVQTLTEDSDAPEERDFDITAGPLEDGQAASIFGEPYPLFLDISVSTSGDVTVGAQYDSKIVSAEQLGFILAQYEVAIREVMSASPARLADIPLLSESDREHVVEWAGEPVVLPEICVHEMIAQVAAACPDHQAVEGFGESLTYGHLEQRANSIAAHLLTLGKTIGPGTVIPVWMDASPTAVVTLLAILKLGASYVPLDSRLPIARAQLIADDIAAEMILVSSAHATSAQQLARKDFTVVEITHSLMDTPDPIPPNPALPSSLAYIIYTSGSTGPPKGVMMSHASLAATLKAQATAYNLTPSTRMFGLANLSWDPSLLEIFATLSAGGTLCIPTPDERAHDLTGTINRFNATVVSTSPAVAALIDLRDTPTVTTVLLGGETLRQENILNAHAAGVKLFNIYGPSEACIDAIVKEDVVPGVSVRNIGRPMSSQVWIVDLWNPKVLAPPGCVGEIVLGGSLAGGYVGDKGKTDGRFITGCGFTNRGWGRNGGRNGGGDEEAVRGGEGDSERVYLTGDLGRFDVNGDVHFLGRRDRQVKLNGQRVELGEIESAVKGACPDEEVVVDHFAAGGSVGGGERKVLVVFFVDNKGGKRAEGKGQVQVVSQVGTGSEEFERLQTRLREVLPAYMVPRVFVTVSNMPLSSADKVDFRALRGAYERWGKSKGREGQTGEEVTAVVPLTGSEGVLRDLWAVALGCCADSIRAQDNFFDLGADSLTAIKLATLATKRGTPISLPDIYASPVLKEMARLLRKSGPRVESGAAPAPFSLLGEELRDKAKEVAGEGVVDMFPCTPVQTASLIQGQKRHKAHYAWFLVKLDGPVDDQQMRSACNLLCRRHDVLRSSFCVVDGHILQVVHGRPTVDFGRLDQCASAEEFCSIVGRDVTDPVSFGRVLTRFRVAAYGEQGTLLAIGISHAQYDGFCFNTILNDLHHAYVGGLEDAKPAPEFTRFVGHVLENEQSPKTESFWTEMLHSSRMTMVTPHLEPHVRLVLDSKQVRSMPAYRAGPCNTTFAMVAKVAWAVILSWLSGTTDVVFGSLVFGRNPRIEGIDEMVGACINVIPSRVQLTSQSTIAALLARVKEQQIAAMPFETTPLKAICRFADWPSTTRFGSIVQHQNIDESTIDAVDGGWSFIGNAGYPGLCDDVDCWITTIPLPEETVLHFEYNAGAIPDGVAASISDLICEVIAAVYEDPSRLVSDLKPGDVGKIRVPTSNCHLDAKPNTVPASKSDEHCNLLPTLRGLWNEALQLREHDQHTEEDDDASFFELGGDSVAAVQLVESYRREDVPLELQDMFDFPTRRLQVQRVVEAREAMERSDGGGTKEGDRLVFEPKLL